MASFQPFLTPKYCWKKGEPRNGMLATDVSGCARGRTSPNYLVLMSYYSQTWHRTFPICAVVVAIGDTSQQSEIGWSRVSHDVRCGLYYL